MTVSNQTARTSAVGTGAEQTIPFTFPITNNSDIVVTSRVITTGVETTLTETTHYTVTNNGESGGSITTVTPFIASTSQIHIVRNTPNTQSLDLEQGGAFNAENIEDALDKATRLTIENADLLNRTLKFPTTDPSTSFSEMPNSVDRASKFLAFDSDGKPTASSEVASTSVSHSALGTSIAEAADAQTVRALIELDSTDDVTFTSVTATVDSTAIETDDIKTKLPIADVTHADFGATGDGVTDDTAAIQAAIDSLTSGGIVFLPEGDYLISAPVNLTTLDTDPGIIFKGAGTGRLGVETTHVTRILNSADTDGLVTRSLGGCVIQDLTIEDTNGARTTGAGILMQRTASAGQSSVIIKNVQVQGHQDGIRLVWSQQTVLDNVICMDAVRDGFRLEDAAGGNGTSTTFRNCFANACGNDGFSQTGHTYTLYENCASDAPGQHGYSLAADTHAATSVTYINCGCEGPTLDGFNAGASTFAVTYLNCFVTGAGSDGIQANGSGINIIGGKYQLCTTNGINIAAGARQTITGVEFSTNGTDITDATNLAVITNCQNYAGIRLPFFTDATRPAVGQEGTLIYNNTWNWVEVDDGTAYRTMAGDIRSDSGLYDFSVDGGAQGDFTLFTIPTGCSVTRAWYEVLTAPTSGGAATIAFGVATNDPTGILSATAYNDAAFTEAYHDSDVDGTASTFTTKTTTERAVVLTVAGADLTAGKIKLWVEYVRSQ